MELFVDGIWADIVLFSRSPDYDWSNGSLTSATNTWGGSQINRPLDGSVDLVTGDAEFNIWSSAGNQVVSP